MNKLETAEAIKVMQAWIDGEEIGAYRDNGERLVIIDDEPSWNWGTCEYHIKPKPREWWINPDAPNGDAAERLHYQGDDCLSSGCIKVREVLE